MCAMHVITPTPCSVQSTNRASKNHSFEFYETLNILDVSKELCIGISSYLFFRILIHKRVPERDEGRVLRKMHKTETK